MVHADLQNTNTLRLSPNGGVVTPVWGVGPAGSNTVPTNAAIDARTRTGQRPVGQGELMFNVKDYGALGDGVTDDTTVIQTAADAACAAHGTLFFPPGTYMVNPAATNASGTSVCLINLTGPVHVQIHRRATVKVISSTTPFVTVFGATTTVIDMGGTLFDGGGTIDCNSADRVAAHVVPNTTTPNVGIGRMNVGNDIKIQRLRFTNFDSVWCVALSSSGAGNMSNVEIAHCQFDNLGTATAADKHDFSAIYIDAIGMSCHHNKFWAGTPGAQTFSTNYGARTAIELHGSGQKCHNNESYGLQWGGNLWISYNSWIETDSTGSKNSVGISWHDNAFQHCAVGVNLGGGTNAGTNYGLSGVNVHHNVITVNPAIWNVNTGGGVFASGVMLASGLVTGSMTGIDISHNDISITENNTAMNAYSFVSGPDAPATHISVAMVSSNVTILKDWTIANNRLRGSCRDGIHLEAYSYEGLSITNNKIADCHLVSGASGYAVYAVTSATTAGTNNFNNVLIGQNHLYDDQTATNSPYGYTTQTASGVVFCNAGSASNAEVLDNGYHCKSGATLSVAAGFASSPAPFLRAFDHAVTFAAPSNNWAAGSTVTTMTQRNALVPVPSVWVQSAIAANGAGSTWLPRSSVSTLQMLATVTGINAKTTGTTTLFTVPASRTAVVTGAVVRCTAASAITVAATLGIGVAAGEADIFASVALTGLTTTGLEWTFTSSGLAVTAAAAAVIKVGIDTAATGTSQTLAIDLLGYLI